MSIFRGITAGGMDEPADTVHMETTPQIKQEQGVLITVRQAGLEDSDRAVVISLADGRELAGWLIEHCVTGEPAHDPTVPPPTRMGGGTQ